MNKESAIRALNVVISSGVTRTALGIKLNVHPSQVSRIAKGDFKRLDGHALRVCKYAKLLAATRAPSVGPLGAAAELEAKLARLMQINPEAAEALSEMLDALVEVQV